MRPTCSESTSRASCSSWACMKDSNRVDGTVCQACITCSCAPVRVERSAAMRAARAASSEPSVASRIFSSNALTASDLLSFFACLSGHVTLAISAPDHEDRAVGVPDHGVGDAPHQGPVHAAQAPAANHDEAGLELLTEPHELAGVVLGLLDYCLPPFVHEGVRVGPLRIDSQCEDHVQLRAGDIRDLHGNPGVVGLFGAVKRQQYPTR